jgi:predicted transcriptional regulator
MATVRVGDIMIPLDQYPHVLYTYTLQQAIEVIENSELNVGGRKSLPRSVLIFDENYQLMGMIRRRDILRGLEPEFLLDKPLEYRKKLFDVKVDPNLSELSYDKIIKGARENAKLPVSRFMKPIEVTVDYEDHIFKAIYEMNSRRLDLLPVMRNNEVIGVIRTVDVFHEVAKLLKEDQ